MQIELPWPAKEVWPNYRQSHHWSSFTKARKAQRELAKAVTLATKPKPEALVFRPGEIKIVALDGLKPLPERIPVRVEFFPPDRRNRDDDGCIGAFKSARDGIADALGVDDKRFRCEYHFAEPEKPGKIVVTIG